MVSSARPARSASWSDFSRKRRVHLEVGVVALDAGIGQREVMRHRLGGNLDVARFRLAHEPHRLGAGEMLHVNARAGEFREQDVARDDHVLGDARPAGQAQHGAPVALVHHAAGGKRVVLAMVEREQVEHPRVVERAAHDLVVLHAMAVVGDRDHARLDERADGRELLAFHADGDAAGGEDVHAARSPPRAGA